MGVHEVRMGMVSDALPKARQLAWKLAVLATDESAVDATVAEQVINHLIDNTALALAAINERPVANARSQAIAHPNAVHPRSYGARIIGLPKARRCSAEWAAWANGVAVSVLQKGTHPADCIPAIVAVAQQCGRKGEDLLRGIVTAFEVHRSLAHAVDVDSHGIDSVLHLAPAIVCGIGATLGLNADVIYQAIQQAVHVSVTTRQTYHGETSSWRVYAAAHVSKLAIEAVDRCMRGEDAPSPIYEGEDSVLVRMLDGAQTTYHVQLPLAGDNKKSVLECDARIIEISGIQSHRDAHIRHFGQLAKKVVSEDEWHRFLRVVQRLPTLTSGELAELNVVADLVELQYVEPDGRGIF